MKYMLLIYQNPAAVQQMSEADKQATMAEAGAIMEELMERGEWVGGEALADATTAVTVRPEAGVPAVTDGPFAEAKEQLVGVCILDVETRERAIEIGRRWPDAKVERCGIELRPILTPDAGEV